MAMKRPVLLPPLATAALLAVTAAGADAQAIRGRVVHDGSGHPVSGVRLELLLPDSSAVATRVSNSDGYFLIATTPGTYRLRGEALGFRPGVSDLLELAAGDTLRVELRLGEDAVRLAPLSVEASARRTPEEQLLADVMRRKQAGFGVVMGPDEIGARNPFDLGDLFRDMQGMRRKGDQWEMSGTFGPCSPTLFVDGHRAGSVSGFTLPASSIRALEVHRKASKLPPQFMIAGGSCGVVLVWTWVKLGDLVP